MSYKPEIRKDLLHRLYILKHSLSPKTPITKLVNQAVEEFLERQNSAVAERETSTYKSKKKRRKHGKTK